MPQCSVVIPWYLNLDDLDRAVASIMAQTIQDFEIIIVVNGVPESVTSEVRAHFADDRVHVLYSDIPQASRARNVGLQHAAGELIFLLDADDIFYPNKLENFINLNNREPFELAFSRGVRQRGDNISWPFPVQQWDGNQHISEFFFCGGNTISASALVLSAAAAKQVRFDEIYKPYEDPTIVLDAVHVGLRVSMLADELYEWNDERVENRLSQGSNYDERLEWAASMGSKLTEKARHAFKARCVAQHRFPKRPVLCISIIAKAWLADAISIKEACLFLVRGLIPASLRRRLISQYFLRRELQMQGQ